MVTFNLKIIQYDYQVLVLISNPSTCKCCCNAGIVGSRRLDQPTHYDINQTLMWIHVHIELQTFGFK